MRGGGVRHDSSLLRYRKKVSITLTLFQLRHGKFRAIDHGDSSKVFARISYPYLLRVEWKSRGTSAKRQHQAAHDITKMETRHLSSNDVITSNLCLHNAVCRSRERTLRLRPCGKHAQLLSKLEYYWWKRYYLSKRIKCRHYLHMGEKRNVKLTEVSARCLISEAISVKETVPMLN
jgi:hypothetical protein